MWKECVDSLLNCERSQARAGDSDDSDKEPLIFIDGTLGGGGHSAALLQNLDAGDIVFGCDVDSEALETASNRLEKYMDHDGKELPFFIPVQSNFGELDSTVTEAKHPVTQQTIVEQGVDGILLDLGVSSHQIDTAERGFAFMKVRLRGFDTHLQHVLFCISVSLIRWFISYPFYVH
jgi:16S rRNA C1402 N4-methylase RsmH